MAHRMEVLLPASAKSTPSATRRYLETAFGRSHLSTLTKSEQRVMRTYRKFLMTPGQMLCFYGPDLKQNETALANLTNRDLLIKERFKGGYSLTKDGYDTMKAYE